MSGLSDKFRNTLDENEQVFYNGYHTTDKGGANMERLDEIRRDGLLPDEVHRSNTKKELISIITEMLEKANEEDLKLILVFVESYLRKKK